MHRIYRWLVGFLVCVVTLCWLMNLVPEAGVRFEGGVGRTSMRYRESAIDTAGCVLWLKMNETSGDTAFDSSSWENDGVLSGGTDWVDGYSGSALSFDGVDDYVDCGDTGFPTGNEPRTIEGWVNIKGYPPASSFGAMAGYGTFIANKSFWMGFYVNNKLYLSFTGPSYETSVSWTPELGRWYFWTGTYDGDTLRIYVDGVLLKDESGFSTDTTLSVSRIGELPPGNIYPLNGFIDEVRIYRRALSAKEIKAHYQKGVKFRN